MPTIFDADTRSRLLQRLQTLNAERKPAWGRMNATQMVAHVTGALRMGLGELAVARKDSAFSRWPLNTLVMHVLPWPKGAPTAPELRMSDAEGWDDHCSALRGVLARFGEQGPSARYARHPAFGDITGTDWGRLMYRHADWHFRQFGA